MTISHEAACAAADWWAEKITSRQHHDNGDQSSPNVIAMFLADSLSKPVTAEQVDTFKTTLIDWMNQEVQQYVYRDEVYLGCDYNPGRGLHEALEAAGISKYNLPFKTSMYVREDEVYVYDGYGAPREKIFPQ